MEGVQLHHDQILVLEERKFSVDNKFNILANFNLVLSPS